MTRLALIDGDVLAYHACKPRWEAKSKMRGVNYVSLDWDGSKIPLEFSKEEDAKYMEQSWNNFQNGLRLLIEESWSDDYLMAVKGKDNYRYDVYEDYKAPRHIAQEKKPNEVVPALRELAVMSDLAIASHGREADDMLRIWANESRAINQEYVICSIDKDLLCIPGLHFNMKHKTLTEITLSQANRHYYEQLLKGDPTDNIPGVKGVGNVKAAKLISHVDTVEEFQEIVVETYIEVYGEVAWENELLANGKMIHLQEHAEDYFNFSNWPIVKELRRMGQIPLVIPQPEAQPVKVNSLKTKIDPSKIKFK